MSLRILHTNDFHGTLDDTRVHMLRALRTDQTLYFDSGDAIRTGNLGIPLRPEPAWDLLSEAGCDASVLGNRETHVLASAFQKKTEGARHKIVVANLYHKGGARVFPASHKFQVGDLRIGVIGGMVPMVTERMKSAAMSAFLWTDPTAEVCKEAADLRPHVDLLIAITHIGHRNDLHLAEACPELDVILGGHSHTIVETPVIVGTVAVCQGGSHGRFVGVYEWSPDNGLSGGLRPFASLEG